MIRPIDIRLNAAHPDYPLAEAVTFTGSPATVLIRGVPPNCGRWAITAVSVAATFPDGSTTTRAAVQSANGVWVATLPATMTSGRTANGLRILADGIDENGEAVTGYVLGVADFAVASLGVTPAPEPGETSWQMLYFDAVPGTLRKGDVAKVDGVLKLYNGTAWEAFAGDIPAPSTATPAMDGTGAPGISTAYARGDHVHPTDTSRVPTSRTVNGKALTGNVTLTGADIPASTGSALTIDQSLEANASAIGSIGNLAEQTAQGLSTHTGNTTIHVTAAEKATWNGKQSALSAQQLANIAAVPDKLDKSGGTMTGGLTMDGGNLITFSDQSGTRTMTIGINGDIFEINLYSYGTLVYTWRTPYNSGVFALASELSHKLDSTSAAPVFSTSSTYAVGEHVTYNGALYRCTTAVTTAGAWDASKWTADMASNYFQYALTTKTIANGAVSLDDRAINAVAVSSTLASLTVNFPTATSGKARDFGLRLTVASGITTAPELALPQGVVCENADGEAPEIGADGAATILYFTETASGVFLVKGEVLQTITA